ncbi:U3 small nucleolar RNA-associated protein 18 homolog [Drosophila takahashii]|uniref:U3 small nucleolar RNA-associated protein 18 homolog n=1 Tax=Drosophila takahashii TaxID=29030 RepID=UPI001CF86C38|nr:U3 small nucleolar RNA-associated protein 18 homolog [Drosophila takahashii]
MSSDESSDGLEDLKDLMALYGKQEEEQAKQKQPRQRFVPKASQAKDLNYVEVPMEKVLFGDRQRFLTNLAKSVGQKWQPSDDGEEEDDRKQENPGQKRKAAWSDSDDEDIQVGDVKRATKHTGPLNHLRKDKSYKEYLTARFHRTLNQPKWAEKKVKNEGEENSSDDEEDLLKTVGFIDRKAARGSDLPQKTLNFKRVKDLNRSTYSEGLVTSIQFHPTSTAALVAGENSIATIYTVDGQKNEKLHSMRFKKFALICSRIAPCGTKAFFGSLRRFYYSYDLLEAKESKLTLPGDMKTMHQFEVSPCGKFIIAAGKFGAIHLLTANTNELLHSFKQEGKVKGLTWSGDSKRVLVCGASSNVTVLNLRQNLIEHTFLDDGCINGQCIQLAPNQRLLATGSKEGVVNVYDYESVFASKAPQPEKRFMNLRTGISDLQFNHSSELLAMSSSAAPNAVKLAHFPSATVYSNFPEQSDNLGYVDSMAFSPHSSFLALATKGKRVPLFRLKYFKGY